MFSEQIFLCIPYTYCRTDHAVPVNRCSY